MKHRRTVDVTRISPVRRSGRGDPSDLAGDPLDLARVHPRARTSSPEVSNRVAIVISLEPTAPEHAEPRAATAPSLFPVHGSDASFLDCFLSRFTWAIGVGGSSHVPFPEDLAHGSIFVQYIDGLRQCGLEVLLTFSNSEPELASEDPYSRHHFERPRLVADIEVALHIGQSHGIHSACSKHAQGVSLRREVDPAQGAPNPSPQASGLSPLTPLPLLHTQSPSQPLSRKDHQRIGCLGGYRPQR